METMAVKSNTRINVSEEDKNMDEIKRFWIENDIQVKGRDVPLPVLNMCDIDWPQTISSALKEDRFTEPTPIQSQGWPIVLSGRDMVGVAQTGSGKTLCYVLPAFVKLLTSGEKSGMKCLVLAPTRELVQQIHSVVQRYNFGQSVCLFGGASRLPQMKAIQESNPVIIISTPGRLIDFLDNNVVDLKTIDYLVLDEADRMLDMGFEPQIKKIIEQIPLSRQTVMWSATWPQEVQQLAKHYMKDYIQINVGGTQLTANKNIKQIVEICDESEKRLKLFDLLHRIRADLTQNKTLVFVRTKQSVDFITNNLQSEGWPAVCLHGDKSQFVRDRVLQDFRDNRFSILVATDVAARGLDVDDIQFVINYDFPNTCEDYVHRIGRTGRLDRKGTAFTFLCANDSKQSKHLIEVLRESNQTISPELLDLANNCRNVLNMKWKSRSFYPNDKTYGQSSSYGYSNRVLPNNGYQRNTYYNKYETQTQQLGSQSESGRQQTSNERYFYGANSRHNYRSNDSNYGSNYSYGQRQTYNNY